MILSGLCIARGPVSFGFPMRWQYLFFDLDGTLTDPMLGITRAAQSALHRFGIEVPDPRALTHFIGPPLRETFMTCYGLDATQAEQAVAAFRAYYTPQGIFENTPYAGIVELLRDTQEAGLANVMATSKPEVFARRIADRFGFTERFTFIGGSTLDDTRTSKQAVIRHALETLGIGAAQAVMIGDRRYDIEGARAEGLASIGVLWGYGSQQELEAAGPDLLAPTVDDLRRLLLT